MDIQLVEHIGMKEVPGKDYVEQSLDQDQIMIDGVRVGYAPHGEGKPLLLIRELSESTIAAIKIRLDIRDGQSHDERKVAAPQPLETLEDLGETDDDDDDE